MLRFIFAIGLVLCIFCPEVVAQACGYSHAKFFVTDSTGNAIRNANFEFLETGSSKVGIHSSQAIKRSLGDASYLLTEGMCGGHRDIRVKIKSDGFESIERIIDLPLNSPEHPLLYRIRLVKLGTGEVPSFDYVSILKGTIFDANGAVVPGTKVLARNLAGRIFTAVSNVRGEYSIELPYNRYDRTSGFQEAKYTISFEQAGFAKNIIEYVFVPSQFGSMNLDIGLRLLGPSPSP